MIAPPEFSRQIGVEMLSPAPHDLEIEASEEERAALARRFGLVAIASLRARAALTRSGDTITATGRLAAEIVQSCVASAEPVEASLEEAFTIDFRPQPAAAATGEEGVELSEAELDVIFYDSVFVDIGEAVAETLLLSLDPYPRAPGAEGALREAGVKSEGEAGPFAALAGLRDALKP